MQEREDRFYLLRAGNYQELVLLLNTLPYDDFVVIVEKDKSIRYNNRPTYVALIERGKPSVSTMFDHINTTVSTA